MELLDKLIGLSLVMLVAFLSLDLFYNFYGNGNWMLVAFSAFIPTAISYIAQDRIINLIHT